MLQNNVFDKLFSNLFSAVPRFFFNPFLSVWISDETLFHVFDILLTKQGKRFRNGNLQEAGKLMINFS